MFTNSNNSGSYLTVSNGRLRHLGYTLFELLATISVMGILATVAIPGLQDIVLDNRRASLANQLSHSIQVARSEAVTRNQRITVCASVNGTACATKDYWSSGWIIFNDLDGDLLPGGDDESILKYTKGNDKVTIAPNSFINSFTYRPNGRVVGDAAAVNTGEFVFCDSRGAEKARVLIIGTNGRPRLEENLSDGSAPSCS
jgi:type IV fimbrial biogenesis protein FimT